MTLAATIAAGYLLGSVPFGLLLGYALGVDVRQHGSNNIGATNVGRVCGMKWGAVVLLLDALKGYAAAGLIAPFLAGDAAWAPAAGGVAAVVGHSFPVWLRFRGGKGVATGAGMLAAALPVPLLMGLAAFVVVVFVFRYISLGSMTAALVVAVSAPILADAPWGKDLPNVILAFAVFLLVMVRHRANIARLFAGTENRFSFRRSSAASNVTNDTADDEGKTP